MRKYFLIILLFAGFVSQGQTPMRMLAKNATVSTPVLEALNFTNVSYGVIESPTGTWGSAAYGGYAVATKSLSGDGWIEAEVSSIANLYSVIGLSLNNTLNGRDWQYTMYIYGTYTGTNIGAYEWSGITAQVGDKMRLKRTGTTITGEYYRAGVWTVISAFTTTSSATLYLKIATSAGNMFVVNPKGSNIY